MQIISCTYNFRYQLFSKLLLLCLFTIGFAEILHAQALSIRNKWEGQYDVRMIGSMVMQPAFVNSVNPVTVTGFLTDDMMRRTGSSFSTNNKYLAFPDTTHLLPLNVKHGYSISDLGTPFFSFTCPSVSPSKLSYKTEKTRVAMVYADCDEDTTTFQSSWAYLDLGENKECAKIEAAYLYWVGTNANGNVVYDKYPNLQTMKSFAGGDVGNVTADFRTIKLRLPSDNIYKEVSAFKVFPKGFSSTWIGPYVCVADISEIIRGSGAGKYWVANVQSSSFSYTCLSGWSIVIVYSYNNCPTRQIVLFDGLDWINTANSHKDYKLDNLQAPSTANFKSYLGLGVLDGENVGPEIISLNNGLYKQYNIPVTKLDGTTENRTTECNFETLDFCAGGDTVKINPFATDQAPYRFADANGVPYTKPQPTQAQACNLSSFESLEWVKGIDGVSSSKITTYDEVKNTNGNKIQRMPDLSNTLGFDLHHFRLPQGAITNGATTANMRIKSGAQGATGVFLAYIAIETLQPLLNLKLETNKESVDFSSNEITYTLKIFNKGGKYTLPGEAYIVDTLHYAIDSIKEFEVPSAANGLRASLETGDVQTDALTGKKFLKIQMLDSIPAINVVSNQVAATDTVIVKFTAVIKDQAFSLWRSKCRRVVENSAKVYFRDVNNSEVSNISNGDACNLNNTDVPVQVSDSVFDTFDKRYILNVALDLKTLEASTHYQLPVLKKIMQDTLVAYGLPISDVELMTFYNASGDTIRENDLLDLQIPEQSFSAVLNFGKFTCSETYNINLYLAHSLTLTHSLENPSCAGYTNGRVNLSSMGGISTDTIQVNLYQGQYSTQNPTPNSLSPLQSFIFKAGLDSFTNVAVFDSLSAGAYTLVTQSLVYDWLPKQYDTLTLINPFQDTITILADSLVCEGNSIHLSAIPTHEPIANSYVWEQSPDMLNWSAANRNSSTVDLSVSDSIVYYRAQAIINNCPVVSNSHRIRKIPQRILSISPTQAYALMKNETEGVQFVVNSGIDAGNLKYAWSYSPNDSVSWFPITANALSGKYEGFTTDTLNIVSYRLAMNGYRYRVKTQDEAGCEALAYAKLFVSGDPIIQVETHNTSCSYLNDGWALIKISKGTIGQKYKVRIYAGAFSAQNTPNVRDALDSIQYIGNSSNEIRLDTLVQLSAGLFTIQLEAEQSTEHTYTLFEIKSASPIVVTVKTELTKLCINEKALVYANAISSPDNVSLKYVWEHSLDAINWSVLPNIASNAASYIMDASNYFRAKVYAGACSVKSEMLYIEVLPTPKVEVLPTDTGCFKFDLHNLRVKESTGLLDLRLSLHRSKPKNATDNSDIILEDNYMLVQNSKIYARMVNQNRCYGLDSAEIYIKPMDECYPIFVPEFFSPDGDGINDVLQISGLEEYENPVIIFYNVSGEIVFRGGKEDFVYPNAWDGTYLGHKLPDADYWYYIKSKEIKPKLGHFSLKRHSRYNR